MSVVQSEGSVLALRRDVLAPPWWQVIPRIDRGTGLELIGDYSAIYRTQPNVQTCVRFRARNFAHVGLHAFRRVSDTERNRLPGDHELSQIIRQPNRFVSRYRYFEALESDLCVFGNHFSVKLRRPTDGRLELWRIPPQYVRLAPEGSWLHPSTWIISAAGNELTVPAESMFHVATHNPDDPRVGLSPLEPLRQILNEEEQAGRYRENFWRNAARHEGVLSHPDKLSKTAADRISAEFKSLTAGEKASGGTVVLEEGMRFTPISFNAKDSQYLEAQKLRREVVASELHIPPACVGILEHANFANMREQHTGLYQDCLGPEFASVEEEFERQVIPDIADTTDVYTEFNIREKLKGSFEQEAAVLQTATGGPYMTRNEARARLNLPPVDSGDELIVPLNVLVGGQASPTDSAPPPKELARVGALLIELSKNGHERIGAAT